MPHSHAYNSSDACDRLDRFNRPVVEVLPAMRGIPSRHRDRIMAARGNGGFRFALPTLLCLPLFVTIGACRQTMSTHDGRDGIPVVSIQDSDLKRMPAWELVGIATGQYIEMGYPAAAFRNEMKRRELEHGDLSRADRSLMLSPEALSPIMTVATLNYLWSATHSSDGENVGPYFSRSNLDGESVVWFDLPWLARDEQHLYIAEIVGLENRLIARWVAWRYYTFPNPFDENLPRDDAGTSRYGHPIRSEHLRGPSQRLRLLSTGLARREYRAPVEELPDDVLRELAESSVLLFEIPMPCISLYVKE